MAFTTPTRSLRYSLRYSILTFLLVTTFVTLLNRHNSFLSPQPISLAHPLSKIIVVASQKEEDTTWLTQRLPTWSVARYVVDDSTAEFQVPLNKGREAMVYLTYLIDHYENLPEIIVFIHSLQYQWHNDDPNHDGATVLSHLQLPYVETEGYVNLRCVWILGCPEEIHPNDEMTDESLAAERVFREAYIELFYGKDGDGFKLEGSDDRDIDVPDAVGVSCCAQFAISRAAALARPKSDYEWFRRWLVSTDLEDAVSGRVFEYSWHMIFGKPSVFCPDAKECYCNVLGMCDLQGCKVDACEGMYELPAYTDIPDGWRQFPEFDDVD